MLNRTNDVLVPRAAAQVAFEPVADATLREVTAVFDQLDGGHDHAGCAEPALEAVHLAERLLHRMQSAVAGQSLDGCDRRIVGPHRPGGAGPYPPAGHTGGT